MIKYCNTINSFSRETSNEGEIHAAGVAKEGFKEMKVDWAIMDTHSLESEPRETTSDCLQALGETTCVSGCLSLQWAEYKYLFDLRQTLLFDGLHYVLEGIGSSFF